ncbi:hypothetical protein C8R45DRAFT_938037 [Mycena sanguinolenta]|nr:hypothetical protein C8R45DRAFT_938037 [Mycena sanguinolenta]
MGPPFFDGFSDGSSDLGSLFLPNGDSANWDLSWSAETFWQLENEYTSLPSFFDDFEIFPLSWRCFWPWVIPRLHEEMSLGLLICHLSISGTQITRSGAHMGDLKQYELPNVKAQKFIG